MTWVLVLWLVSGEERVWERYATLSGCLRDVPAVAQTMQRDLRAIGCARVAGLMEERAS